MGKFYVIDGNSLFFRSFYATFRPGVELMHNSNGVPTNALYGFANMILKIHGSLSSGDRMVVCFDTGHPSFRSQQIESYKSQRKPTEEALKIQIPLAHTMLDSLGIARAEMEGYEGDDVAGSLAKYGQSKGDEVTLFTSDKDFFQLIDDHIKVECLKVGLSNIIEYTKDNIAEKFGCRADQIVDFKAIAGDPSDNYKGIPGIGEATAFKLLSQYDHLEDILEAYKDDEKTSVGKKLNAGAEEGRRCRWIATILTDLDVDDFYQKANVNDLTFDSAKKFFREYDLNSIVRELDKRESALKKKASDSMQVSLFEDIEDEQKFEYPKEKVIADIGSMDSDPVSVSVILDGKIDEWNENINKIIGFVLSDEKGALYFLKSELASSAKLFKEWLKKDNNKRSLDSKSMYVCADRLNLDCGLFDFDFLLASYIINSDKSKDLKDAMSQLGILIDENPIARILQCTHAMNLNYEDMVKRLKDEDQYSLLSDVEIPLARTLADMEIEGMPIDLATLNVIGDEYKKTLASITEGIMQYVDNPNFNINSYKQVEDLLFNKLGIQKDKSDKGVTSEVLQKHYDDHPIIPLILQHRTYSKIISGYVDSLPKHILKDGKIHALINQTLTTTGRLSMSEPNLQNISIRKEEGKELRKAFFYDDPDYEFLSFDYSQIELRVMASIGNIKALKEVCSSGEDIHAATAAKFFGVPIDQVTSDMRRMAKTVNFGIVYGISVFGLAQRLGCSKSEAAGFIAQFKNTFEGIEQYQNNEIELARNKGYVTTILHRRRHFPDINSPSAMLRKFSERAAVNASIQGSAADLIKVAMNSIQKMLKGRKSKMTLQIHDELVFKLHKDEKDELIKLIPQIMDDALDDVLDVKLQVEGNLGHSWYDCK